MSPVRRRTLRREGRLWLFIGLAAAALILGGLWLLLHREAAVPPPTPKEDPTTLLFFCEEEALSSIEIANDHDAYALERNASGGWGMAGEESFPFRQAMLDSILANASYLLAEETVGSLTQNGWQPADFGLDGGISVRVHTAEGCAFAFRIGDRAPVEVPSYFMMVEGADTVYTVAEDVYESFAYTRQALREVANPALQGKLIDRIAFTGRDPFTLEKRSEGWVLTAPFEYPLSDTAVDALLSKLESLRFAQYVGAQAEEEYGLSPALRTLTLDIAPTVVTGYDDQGEAIGKTALPAYQLTLEMGHYAGSTAFYCRYKEEILKATVFTAGFLLTQGYESLLSTAPFTAGKGELLHLALTREGRETVYDVSYSEQVLPNNELARDDAGSLLYDMAVTCGGEGVDTDAFLAAYTALMDLRAADWLPADYALPEVPPVWSVTLTWADARRTVSLYPLDALHRALAVNGTALFRVETGWAERISWP